MSDPTLSPFELVGDADGGMCVDGVCAVPVEASPAEDIEKQL